METTGNFADWTGDMLAIGPLYPFVGSEMLLAILLLVFWLGWHILQIAAESRRLREEQQALAGGRALEEAMATERAPERF